MHDQRPYQVEGSKWLAQTKRGLLADDMGLGKTNQVVTACDLIQAKRVLIVGPAVGRINWVREWAMWSIYDGLRTVKHCSQLSDPPDADVVSVSYDYARENAEVLSALGWDVLVVDEAHKLKNLETNNAKAILGKNGIAKNTKRTWFITGTPMLSHAGELWLMLYTFGQTKLSYEKFLRRYCNTQPPKYGDKLVVKGNKKNMAHEVRAMMENIMLRRLKSEVAKDLPPITWQRTAIEEGPVDLELEKSFTGWLYPHDRRFELLAQLADDRETVEGVVRKVRVGHDALDVLKYMSDSVSSMNLYVGLQKVYGVTGLVGDELECRAYDKIVLFAINRGVIDSVAMALERFKPVRIYGGTSDKARQSYVDRFQNDPKCRVAICNVEAAGTALTLTAGNEAGFIQLPWDPETMAQCAMRIHRLGQNKPCRVRMFTLADSFEERVAMIITRKARDICDIFSKDLVSITETFNDQ